MGKKIIVFSAHPDDDLIGCGGSIAKHAINGNEVTVIYLTSGEAGGLGCNGEDLMKIREQEARNAASIIGIARLRFLREPDTRLEFNQNNLRKIIKIITEERPEIVYVNHRMDKSLDHKITCELVMEAVERASWRDFPKCKNPWLVPLVLNYEVWTPLQEFNYVEDITDTIDKKTDALKEHKSQLEYRRYDEAAKCLARYRGIMTGKAEYAEVFQIKNCQRSFISM